MPDYSKSKIYRLDCGDMIYIGSTTQPLAKRKGTHKIDYLRNRNFRSKLLYQYAEDNGLSLTEDIRIELICEYPCDNKEQLDAFEGKYIRQYKEEYGDKCVNKCIAGRTDKEYYEDNKDKILEQKKEYYEDNKDKKKAYQQQNKDKKKEYDKQYREKNKEKLLQQKKEYQQQNKTKIAEKKKEYYHKNKDEILKQMTVYYEDNKDKKKEYDKQYRLFKKIDKMFGL
jgi:hypothetical protein